MSHISIQLGKKIKKYRAQHKITQQKLADMMGVSRPAITQIENGERKISAEELLELSSIFNISVDNLLDLKKEPEVILQEDNKSKKSEPQIRINVPQKKIDKFKEVFIYILNKVASKPNIGETLIYKILYFIDFDFYEKYEEQLIGATYIKNRFGPTPVEFLKISAKMIKNEEITKVVSKYFIYPQTKYLPLRTADLSKLKAHEIEVIDDVLFKLSDMTASKASEYSHDDVPWLTTEMGKPIEYESVFYRTAPYSVRTY